MKHQTFIAAAVQMNCELGNPGSNLEKAYHLIEQAVLKGASFIVLPELFNTGYRVEEKDWQYAEYIPGYTSEWLVQTAQKFNVIIAGCILEKKNDRIYDTCLVVDRDGIQGTYRKIYLWNQEKQRFQKGDRYEVTQLGEVTLGMQICYEVGFPEGARVLTLKGANVLIYSSAFGSLRRYAWDIATKARALENGCFVIASNRTGTEKNETVFGGGSRIINPQGKVLTEATKEDEVIVAEIDLVQVEEQRKAIPYLLDLQNDMYKEPSK
ncbi:carbon-nitrogen hydrolase family protein [Priestia megaterium]|uniref:carbon-nitrogen hydrolase family protein n=1 Tax=Priestia megaterium TaxID=1404 RepID=UPI002877EE68|nr:carbon-nitrogen hydrolase family protein [Priestia megaterium]